WFAVSLVVMMAAMMLPALAPMLVAYERRASRAGRADSVATFAAGYFAAWLAAGLLAYAVIEGVRSLGPGFLAWDEAGRYVAAAVTAGAGLYQLTALKGACLRACSERAAFIAERWRPGRIGALFRSASSSLPRRRLEGARLNTYLWDPWYLAVGRTRTCSTVHRAGCAPSRPPTSTTASSGRWPDGSPGRRVPASQQRIQSHH